MLWTELVLQLRNPRSGCTHQFISPNAQFQCQRGWMRKEMLVSTTGQRSLQVVFVWDWLELQPRPCLRGRKVVYFRFKALCQVMFSHLYLSLKWFGPLRDPFSGDYSLTHICTQLSCCWDVEAQNASLKFSVPKREKLFCSQLKTMKEKQF